MPKKIIKGMTAAFLASLGLATSGLFMPAPAHAYPTCEVYVAQICKNWQNYGYKSQQDCFYWELPAMCGIEQDLPLAIKE